MFILPAPPAAVAPAPAIPDITTLMPQAVRRVRAYPGRRFVHAELYEADGYTAKRGSRTAAGVVGWTFVFFTDNRADATATLTYGPSPRGFGAVKPEVEPTLEDVEITKVPKLTLADAVARLDATGHTAPFSSVVLRNPLGPKVTDPYYIFGFRTVYVGVDVDTGRVVDFG